jgi:ser/thr/tyr protein kinase RAD53
VVGNQHCTLSWDGVDSDKTTIVLKDNSSNGTFVSYYLPMYVIHCTNLSHTHRQINGVKIGKGNNRVLRDGNEIGFGYPHAVDNPAEDYRTP